MHWLLWSVAICEIPQVIESCYHGNTDIHLVTSLFEVSCGSYFRSIFFVPVEFCSTSMEIILPL